MLTLETVIHVDGLRGSDVFDFLLRCTDEQYRRWWPGTHLRFHTLRRHVEDVGNLVTMDEFVGRRRVRLQGVVIEAVPGTRIVWRLKKGVPLPGWLCLDLVDDDAGVTIRHTVRAGLGGIGRALDPLLRLYLSAGFVRDLDAHVRAEFARLRDLLADARPEARPVLVPVAAHSRPGQSGMVPLRVEKS